MDRKEQTQRAGGTHDKVISVQESWGEGQNRKNLVMPTTIAEQHSLAHLETLGKVVAALQVARGEERLTL